MDLNLLVSFFSLRGVMKTPMYGFAGTITSLDMSIILSQGVFKSGFIFESMINTMLCQIKVNSNIIKLNVHNSCCSV